MAWSVIRSHFGTRQRVRRCKVMAVHRARELAAALNGGEYVDVLQGTSLETHAERLGFGLYVVPNALPRILQESWADRCCRMFEAKGREPGGTKVKGTKNAKSHYSTVQAVIGECTCKYTYEGTVKHKLINLREDKDNGVCEVLLKSLSWVHEKFRLERSLHFNELVANEYEHRKEE